MITWKLRALRLPEIFTNLLKACFEVAFSKSSDIKFEIQRYYEEIENTIKKFRNFMKILLLMIVHVILFDTKVTGEYVNYTVDFEIKLNYMCMLFCDLT